MHSSEKYQWRGPPKNFDQRKNERKISWLELFYDLVYVAAIAQLTHQLASHPTWSNLGFGFLLFSQVFWSWVNGSQYYDLHGGEGLRTRVLTFFQMLAMSAVAITLGDAYEGHHCAFAIAFSVVELMITYLWWSVGFYDPSHRKFNIYYTVHYCIALGLFLISIFTDADTATILWIIALAFNLTPSLTGARNIVAALKAHGQVFTASATIVERFGLFTIMVLAESILGTVSGIAEVENKPIWIWLAFILAIMISFLLWSIYFDMTSEQETKTGYAYMQWLVFLHFPLLASLSVVGACIKVLISDTYGALPIQVQWMFCIALSIILIMIVALTRIMKEEEEDRSYIEPVSVLLLICSGSILIIPLFGSYFNTVSFFAIIAVVLFIPVLVGIRSWIQYRFFAQK